MNGLGSHKQLYAAATLKNIFFYGMTLDACNNRKILFSRFLFQTPDFFFYGFQYLT